MRLDAAVDVVVAAVVDASALDSCRDGVLAVRHGRRFAGKVLIEAAEAAVMVAVHLG